MSKWRSEDNRSTWNLFFLEVCLRKSQKGAPREPSLHFPCFVRKSEHTSIISTSSPRRRWPITPLPLPISLAPLHASNSTAVDHQHDPITPSRCYPCDSRYFYTGEEIKKYIIIHLHTSFARRRFYASVGKA